MNAPKIVRLEIIDNQPDKPEDKVLAIYYLLSPNKKKIHILRDVIENNHILNNASIEGLWDIEDYIKKNFQVVNIERTEIKW